MAKRRMFSSDVVSSDSFIDMSHNAQLLYFHLSINADNEGFVNNPKTIIRTIGIEKECLNELIDSRFIIPFDSGVMVITHWRINNILDDKRMKKSTFINERKSLIIENNIYVQVELSNGLANSKELHGNQNNSNEFHANIKEDNIKEKNIKEKNLKELSNIKSCNKEHEEIENSNDDHIPTEEEILKKFGIDEIKF
ncbi:hypothetical protein [Thomasclavelia cocleata]|uniref:hypothetical protein n=1 Tax=Thomasclavelia cocleata TaxID=69824 RepID=UPI0024956E3D|nr:hypothetical protein [Thomasclavelia cocleata]